MRVVAFDIETVPDYMGVNMKDYLYLKNRGQRERTEEEVERDISFNPFTLYVISVALVEIVGDRIERCSVIYASDGSDREQTPPWCAEYDVRWEPVVMGVVENEIYDIEEKILSSFWEFVEGADRLVSFNGHDFDGYVIRVRSMLHDLKPSSSLLRGGRDDTHIDLLKFLSNYDRSKRLTLEFICRKFGIPTTKDRIDGSRVAEEFFKGNYRLIAEYNLKDALALAQLYLKVKDFLEHPVHRHPSEQQAKKLTVLLQKIGRISFDKVKDAVLSGDVSSEEVSKVIDVLERLEKTL
ncbi:MAG: ribonuclease H-like domain-containing protein [Aquificota bacterium]|nr:ribonuclease H-like domain-containing protein [Aquificota bacterium]